MGTQIVEMSMTEHCLFLVLAIRLSGDESKYVKYPHCDFPLNPMYGKS